MSPGAHRPPRHLQATVAVRLQLRKKNVLPEISEVRSNKYSANDLRRFDQAETEASALLLRKEVIQPQVPLRLPCYDFVPITSLTLGRRLF